eukprot:comp21133_c0_seq1/m.44706 comp21133_c0_seq1/g.44706  ORF comp21133_c0_seq1/g.44706 comp21133_c0_seq1/m.44706 type:complete len:374 (-) comp21133_c0_seq1:137-1258(-)
MHALVQRLLCRARGRIAFAGDSQAAWRVPEQPAWSHRARQHAAHDQGHPGHDERQCRQEQARRDQHDCARHGWCHWLRRRQEARERNRRHFERQREQPAQCANHVHGQHQRRPAQEIPAGIDGARASCAVELRAQSVPDRRKQRRWILGCGGPHDIGPCHRVVGQCRPRAWSRQAAQGCCTASAALLSWGDEELYDWRQRRQRRQRQQQPHNGRRQRRCRVTARLWAADGHCCGRKHSRAWTQSACDSRKGRCDCAWVFTELWHFARRAQGVYGVVGRAVAERHAERESWRGVYGRKCAACGPGACDRIDVALAAALWDCGCRHPGDSAWHAVWCRVQHNGRRQGSQSARARGCARTGQAHCECRLATGARSR